jgi:hypothetical protein
MMEEYLNSIRQTLYEVKAGDYVTWHQYHRFFFQVVHNCDDQFIYLSGNKFSRETGEDMYEFKETSPGYISNHIEAVTVNHIVSYLKKDIVFRIGMYDLESTDIVSLLKIYEIIRKSRGENYED